MTLFRGFLAVLLVVIVGYTMVTVSREGLGLFPLFFGEMVTFGWQGQFNLDFFTFLLLSGLWTAWRGGFTGPSIALGVVAVIFGMSFLAAYLLYLSYRTEGDMARLLLGVHAR